MYFVACNHSSSSLSIANIVSTTPSTVVDAGIGGTIPRLKIGKSTLL